MSLLRKIAHNSIIHLAGKFAVLLIGLMAVFMITRYLGQEGFGAYTTVFAYLLFLSTLVDFGLTMATVQLISRPRVDESRMMNNIMSFRVLLSGIYMILACSLIWVLPYGREVQWGAVIMSFSFFAVTIRQALTGIFQKHLQMIKITIAEVAGKVVMLGLVALIIYFEKSIYHIFAVFSLEGLVTIILAFYFAGEFVDWRWRLEPEVWKQIIKKSWPIALAISFNLIYLKMDTLILSLYHDKSTVGLYGATYRVIDVLTMLPAVFMGVVLPQITKFFEAGKKRNLFDLMQKAFDALMIFGIPTVVGGLIVANPLMVFVAGQEFYLSGDILRVLLLASAGIFGTSLFGYAVVGIDKQRRMVWGYAITAVITLVGYLYFIPRFGYWGAAWMTVFSETMIVIWSAILVYVSIRFFPSLKIFVKAVPAAAIMGFVAWRIIDWPVVAILCVSVVIYFSFLYLFGGIRKEILRQLVSLKD